MSCRIALAVFATWCLADLTAFAQAPEVKPWQAGTARVNITPERLMWMSGYGSRTKPAEGKLTDLWAKALVLQDPTGRRCVFVTLDLVGIPRDLSLAVCTDITKKTSVQRDAILLAASHTHTGPLVGSNLQAMFELDAANEKLVAEYEKTLHSKLVQVVDSAVQKLAAARLSWGAGHVSFAVNRRNNKEPEVPRLRETGQLKGPIDHEVPVLCIRDEKGQVRAIVCSYACHATVLSFYQWSGDWPGFAQIALEKAHPDCTAYFIAGCGADQNPLPRRAVTQAEQYGQELAEGVNAVLRAPMTPIKGGLATAYVEIELPFSTLPTREQLLKDSMSTAANVARHARYLLRQLEAKGSLRGTYPYPVQAWQLGADLTLVALGGEVVVDYALRLKRELGPGTWVGSYANDVMAYIPSLRVLTEGGYEGATSMIPYGQPTVWGPQVEELIVAAAHQLVRKVRDRQPTARKNAGR